MLVGSGGDQTVHQSLYRIYAYVQLQTVVPVPAFYSDFDLDLT